MDFTIQKQKYLEEISNPENMESLCSAYLKLSNIYRVSDIDSGIIVCNQGLKSFEQSGDLKYQLKMLAQIGNLYSAKGDFEIADSIFRYGIQYSLANDGIEIYRLYNNLANQFHILTQTDSAAYYQRLAIKNNAQLPPHLKAYGYMTMATIISDTNLEEEAEIYIDKALELIPTFKSEMASLYLFSSIYAEALFKYALVNPDFNSIAFENELTAPSKSFF